MPVNLSIKNVPTALVEKLRRRAAQNHRSLQGELLDIIESSVQAKTSLKPDEVLARMRQAGLRTPKEAAAMIRKDRDAH